MALVAVPMVGAWGRVEAVTEEVAPEAGPVPLALVAVTENVYDVPAVRPEVMVQLVAVATVVVQLPPAGLEVTVYPVMTEPPLLEGSVQVTTAWGGLP